MESSGLARYEIIDVCSECPAEYVDIPELTTSIVNEFVKKIIFHEADKSSGHRRQTVEIIFNFVGQLEIPILTKPVTLGASPKQRKTA